MKVLFALVAAVSCSIHLHRCTNERPGENTAPLCDGQVTVEPMSSYIPPLPNAPGQDGIGIMYTIPFPCNQGSPFCTGADFAAFFNTVDIGGTRYYHLLLLDGPGTDREWYFTTFEDGYQSLKELLEFSGYDLRCEYTEEFVDAWGTWAESEWISAEDFYATFGY